MIAPYRTAKYLDDTVFAGKTGYTSDALNTLVTCGTRGGMDVIVVSMRTRSTGEKGVPLFTDTAALLDYANNFQKLNIADNEKTFLVGNAYDFSIDTDDLNTSASLISINRNSYAILPNQASFTDAVPSIQFEEHPEGNKAYLVYEYAGQTIGKAPITLEEQKEEEFDFSETESGEMDSRENEIKFITINFKIIFIIFAILFGILFLVFMIYRFYEKNRAKIRKAIHIYQKRKTLKRRRYRRKRRR
jgi:D-alanyl-D-alanine carboxypeptidase (penicillin-binding protein 5/6)